jgi:hypothetical protein
LRTSLAHISEAQPHPSFIHRIVGRAQRSQHAVGKGLHAPVIVVEPLGQVSPLVHIRTP